MFHKTFAKSAVSRQFLTKCLFPAKKQHILARIGQSVHMDSKPVSERPEFPGSRAQFISDLKFIDPSSYDLIPVFQVLNQNGQVSSNFESMVDLDMMKRFYREMVKLNQMDIILYDTQRQGRISFYMTSYGEEATHFGPAAALNDNDLVFGQYREPGVLMWRGFEIEQFINQCFSNENDMGKGRQMPIHYGSKELNYMTIKSTLSSQMLHAVGAAYSFKLQNKDRISLCYFGDGAASEGDAHGSFNFAATLDCPVILLCRNNGYAISTPTEEQYRGDGIAARGPALGIPTIRVDGNDVLACYFATKEARKICIEQSRPVLIEAMTYRISHHSTSDDSSVYRSVDEVKTWSESIHPMNRIELLLRSKNMFNEEEEKEAKDNFRKKFIEVLAENEKLQKPPIKDLFTDVYDEMSVLQKEQYTDLMEHLKEYGKHYPKNFKDFTNQ